MPSYVYLVSSWFADHSFLGFIPRYVCTGCFQHSPSLGSPALNVTVTSEWLLNGCLIESHSPRSLRQPPPAPTFPLHSLEQPDLTDAGAAAHPFIPFVLWSRNRRFGGSTFQRVRSCSRTTIPRWYKNLFHSRLKHVVRNGAYGECTLSSSRKNIT